MTIDINELRVSAANSVRDLAMLPAEMLELIDRLEAAEKERDTYKAAYNEWIAKTEWVQDELTRSKLPAKYLGMHRADVIKVEIDTLRVAVRHEADCVEAAKAEIKALRSELVDLHSSMAFRTSLVGRTEAERDALRAKIEAMERKEPVRWFYVTNGEWDCYSRERPPEDAYDAGSLMALYALPGAQQCKNCNGMGDRFDPSGEKIPCDLCESHLEEIRVLVAEAARDIISGSDFWLSSSLAAKKIYALPGAKGDEE